jgi:hypothetical protein
MIFERFWRMVTRSAMFVAFGTLAGCANHPLDCAIGFAHGDCLPGTAGYRASQAKRNADDSRCLDYGLKFGTPEYAQCRQNIDNQRAAVDREFLRGSMAKRDRPEPAPYMMPVRPSVTTQCATIGNQTTCNSQ